MHPTYLTLLDVIKTLLGTVGFVCLFCFLLSDNIKSQRDRKKIPRSNSRLLSNSEPIPRVS